MYAAVPERVWTMVFTLWQNLQGKQHVFHQKIAREMVSFSPKKRKRKGTVSETEVAHQRTKIRQVPPPRAYRPRPD